MSCHASGRTDTMTTANPWFRALLFGGAAWCACAMSASAQDAGQFVIRVESDLVLVPTEALAKVPRDQADPYWTDRQGRSALSGLTAKDFHLFQDGAEQKIESFTVEPWPRRIVRDNVACHVENFTAPGTRWTSGDYVHGACPTLPRETYYQIAFRPPPAPAGSCHHVNVTVDRPNAAAETRGEYCNTPYSGSDELNGTPRGQWMETRLASGAAGNLPLFLQAGRFYTDAPMAHVHLVLDLPWNSMKTERKNGRLWGNHEILGMVYRRDGGMVERFSENETRAVLLLSRESGPSIATHLGYRFEKQFDLPPGGYDLRVVFSDGTTNFGRAETALTVESCDVKQLGISSVLLGKRYQQASPLPHAERAGSFVPLVSKGIEVTPSGSTRFKRGEPLIAYFEVYEPLASVPPDAQVRVQLRIVDAGTGAVLDAREPFDAAGYRKAGSPVIPIAQKIPTTKLQRGSYRLEVQAKDSAGGSTVWRPASFTIE